MHHVPVALGDQVRVAEQVPAGQAGRNLGATEIRAGGVRLFLASSRLGSTDLARHALTIADEHASPAWQIVRERHRRPRAWAGGERAISFSSAGQWKAVATAAAGKVGLDLETLGRVEQNATADDDWLAPGERDLLASLDPASRVVELGCRWTMREAAGKAIGLGLAAWPTPPELTVEAGVIRLRGGLPGQRWDGWRFQLLRQGELLIALAFDWSGSDAVDTDRKEATGRAGGKIHRPEHL